MSGHIRQCTKDHTYTLSITCPVCGKPTSIAHPARFSLEDHYGKYRRLAKND
ncbi:MAG: RNA-protein complex protein Nop10 [Methanoregula sp.]|jgi:H/ACA ribonucleoprotein complex subunit 3|nr:RNA-protein complex protein Nop10 [Methanoregula sp.]